MIIRHIYNLILILPLVTFVFLMGVGYKIGKKGAFRLASVSMGAELFLVVYLNVICFLYHRQLPSSITFGTWFSSGFSQVEWSFLTDSLTRFMLLVVVGVSSLVHLFSVDYMAKDPHSIRFMAYLTLFTWFMVILVTASNLVLLFVGWEGVGISSYLLINFWYTRVQANKAALKALLMNRIGDCFILIAIVAMFKTFGSVNFAVVNHLVPYVASYTLVLAPGIEVSNLSLISLAIVIGAIGKSAQLGLHTWLPDAMEGPTPVSALIHAATMVTAGVYLILRTSPIIEHTPCIAVFLLLVGAVTALYGSMTAYWQNDIKKIIAYSTCSQLGYMFVACALSVYTTSFYHLFNHAFFKAGLSLASGVIIHSMGEEQDIRRLGGLRGKLPIVYTMMLIGSLSLSGFSFTSGFYSKDYIINISGTEGVLIHGAFIFILINLAAQFSIMYSIKLLRSVFYTDIRYFKASVRKFHYTPFHSYFVLICLSFLSIVSGYITERLFRPGTTIFRDSFVTDSMYLHSVEAEFIPLSIRIIPLYFLFTIPIAYTILEKYLSYNDYVPNVGFQKFFLGKGYFDVVYNKYIFTSIWNFSWFLYRVVDKGILEYLGPSSATNLFSRLSRKLLIIQGYSIRTYFCLSYLIIIFSLYCYDIFTIFF